MYDDPVCPECEHEMEYSHTIRGYRDSLGVPEEPDEVVYVCPNCGNKEA